jgi:hypothetical protein
LVGRAASCDAARETREATVSLRSITVLTALILLQLCGCVTTTSKPSDPSVNELERRHDEMMQRMGGGSGGGM